MKVHVSHMKVHVLHMFSAHDLHIKVHMCSTYVTPWFGGQIL